MCWPNLGALSRADLGDDGLDPAQRDSTRRAGVGAYPKFQVIGAHPCRGRLSAVSPLPGSLDMRKIKGSP